MNELEEYLADDGWPEDATPGNNGFVISDNETAIWAARKLHQLHRRMDDRALDAINEIDRINAWLENADKNDKAGAEFFSRSLQFYHETILRADSKQKTIKLPHAELKARKQPDQYVIDEEAFIEWAKLERDDLINTKTTVALAALKKLGTADPETGTVTIGEDVIPGVTVGAGTTKYSVNILD